MALVPVELVASQLSLFLKCQFGQCLSGALPEWLPALRGIDALQPYFDLLILPRLAAAGGQSVAILDADDKAEEGGCKHLSNT